MEALSVRLVLALGLGWLREVCARSSCGCGAYSGAGARPARFRYDPKRCAS